MKNNWEMNKVFQFRMKQLIDHYGMDAIETGLNRVTKAQPVPDNNSYWLTSNLDYDIIKLHLNNLELTVGSELFLIGSVVFFDLRIGA